MSTEDIGRQYEHVAKLEYDRRNQTAEDEALLWQAREALRLTREYVMPATRLPKIEGWSWWDAVVAIDGRLGREVGDGIMDEPPSAVSPEGEVPQSASNGPDPS
jgi:hypothetical protein